jgi:chromosome segregation ATPase
MNVYTKDKSFVEEGSTMSEQYVTREDFAQVTEAMSAIQNTATRVDERVKILLERQSKSDANIHDIRNTINGLVSRVTILESRNENDLKIVVEKSREKIYDIERQLQTLTMKETTHETRWKTIFDFVGKVLWIATAAYVLYKLGFNPPPIN